MTPVRPDEAERLQRLAYLRDQIFDRDQDLVRIVGQRQLLVAEIAEIKADLGFATSDPERDAAVVRRAAKLAKDEGVDEELVADLMRRIMDGARQLVPGGAGSIPGSTDDAEA